MPPLEQIRRLTYERRQRGWSQTRFASLLSPPVTQAVISAIENGRLVPTAAMRERLAHPLGVSPDSLLDVMTVRVAPEAEAS